MQEHASYTTLSFLLHQMDEFAGNATQSTESCRLIARLQCAIQRWLFNIHEDIEAQNLDTKEYVFAAIYTSHHCSSWRIDTTEKDNVPY